MLPWGVCVKVTGSGTKLVPRMMTPDVEEEEPAETTTLETGTRVVVIGAIVMTTVTVVVPNMTVPSDVARGHVSSIVSVAGGKLIVVVGTVHGGSTRVHGGSQAAVGSDVLQITGSM